jgi:hypothetical protein
MPWPYLLVFVGTLVVDVVPLPLPPAFMVMVLLQTMFQLNIWLVIAIGVPGSVVGRYLLALYVGRLSRRFFGPEFNRDVQFLGRKLQGTGWRVPGFVFLYSLAPVPTAPIFIAGGLAKVKAYQLFPPFIAGKLISDAIAVLMGAHAVTTVDEMLQGLSSWRTFTGIAVGVVLLFALLFVDWRSLLQGGRFALRFSIWNRKSGGQGAPRAGSVPAALEVDRGDARELGEPREQSAK